MANEERLGTFDVHIKRIEGEEVDGQPAFAMATYDASTANQSKCLITSGSYNYANTTITQLTPPGTKGAYFVLDVGGVPASGTLTWFLDIMNPCTNQFSAIAQGSAIPATGSTATPRKYLVYPGAVDTDSNLTHVTQIPLPYQWRCRVITGGGSGTWAYSLGVQYAD